MKTRMQTSPKNQQKIRDNRDFLIQERENVNNGFRELQAYCVHPEVKETKRANTGNYDPSADSHWSDFECPDCDKKWRVNK